MVTYQLCVRSGKEEPHPCRVCGKPTRGMALYETGEQVPLCPAHLNDESAAAVEIAP